MKSFKVFALSSLILASIFGQGDLRPQAAGKSASSAARAKEPGLGDYGPGLSYWTWDFVRLEKQLGAQQGDLPFYLSGMAQARIPDILSPDWRVRFFEEGGSMEDRLRDMIEARK